MKIIIKIPDEEYDTNQRDIESAINELHDFLLKDIDCEVIYEKDGDDRADEFIDGLDTEDATDYEKLDENNDVVSDIKDSIEGDIYGTNMYRKLNGGFVNVNHIIAVKYTDKDGNKKIRFFADIKHGTQDETGTDAIEFAHSSDWTDKGEFIEHFDN